MKKFGLENILGYSRSLSSWILIFIMLYLSIDGIYITLTAISRVIEQTAVENIRFVIGVLVICIFGFILALRNSVLMSSVLLNDFLYFSRYLLFIFSCIGNLELTVYISLIYLVLDIALAFAQKKLIRKRINLNNLLM